MRKTQNYLLVFLIILSISSRAQIIVTNTQTPTELVNDVLVGAGVIVSNVKFNHSLPLAGAPRTQVGFFDATGTTFPIKSGVILGTGHTRLAVGPNNTGSGTDGEGRAPEPFDIDLNAIGTTTINDQAVLEFDFIPSGDSVVFKYIFGSEEYHEFSTSSFNDVFGFFISGPGFAGPFEFGGVNIAVIPGTSLPVTMNNLNNGASNTGPCKNCEFLLDNTGGLDVQYDAYTVVLYARAKVVCGEKYHIKMGIGNAGDHSYDSGVFLEASSFASNGIDVKITSVLGDDAIIEGCDSALVTFTRPTESDTVDLTVLYDIEGMATNGVDYNFLDGIVFFPKGVDTVKFWIIPLEDGITEGSETIIISVEIINECGDTITTSATIEIMDVPDFKVLTTNILLDCPQDSVLLSFDTDGGFPKFDVDWSTGGKELDEYVPGDIVGTKTYTVNVKDVCGAEASGKITVTFDPAPVATIIFNKDEFVICPGQEAKIDATVVTPYSPDITYLWKPTGEKTEDITATPLVSTWYYLTINDGCNTVTDSVQVNIGSVKLTDIIVVDATDCPGIADAEPGSITVLPDNPFWTYELAGYAPKQDNGVFNGLDGGINYILIVTDENGCFTDTIVSVGLGENAVTATWVADSLRNVSCFDANDGGAYVFEISGGFEPPYTVIWSNLGGIFATETVGVDGKSEKDNLPGNSSWVVTIVDEVGCAWSHGFKILEPAELKLDLISNEPLCYGYSDGSVTMNTKGGNGGEIYTITDKDGVVKNIGGSNTANALGVGTYTCTVVDKNGCTATKSILLTQPAEIMIDLDINQPLCYGIPTGFVTVDTVYNYSGPFSDISYNWAPPNPSGNGKGAVSHKNLKAGSYTITINDKNGCANTFDFKIEYPDSLYLIEFSAEPAYCRQFDYQKGNGVISASAGGGTPPINSYEWKNLETGETKVNTTWGGLNPGAYQMTVIDANGCKLIRTLQLDSLNPVAQFDITSPQFTSNYKGTADIDAHFTNKSLNYENPNSPSGEPTFLWNFDFDNIPVIISHDINDEYDTTYKARGDSYTIKVCLTAINKNGCEDSICKIINVYEPIKLENVNIFTPNADGINDGFTFINYAKSIAKFNCVIVNRWGITVGEITSISGSWDGKDMNGTPCKDGIYFYTYEAEADDGTRIEGQGTVTINGSEY